MSPRSSQSRNQLCIRLTTYCSGHNLGPVGSSWQARMGTAGARRYSTRAEGCLPSLRGHHFFVRWFLRGSDIPIAPLREDIALPLRPPRRPGAPLALLRIGTLTVRIGALVLLSALPSLNTVTFAAFKIENTVLSQI